MTREALIEAAMQSCHVHAFIREDGEFQRTPVIVDTAYRTGFAFGVKAAIAAIESAGLAVVPHSMQIRLLIEYLYGVNSYFRNKFSDEEITVTTRVLLLVMEDMAKLEQSRQKTTPDDPS